MSLSEIELPVQAAERIYEKTSGRRASIERPPCKIQGLESLRLQMDIWVSLGSADVGPGESCPRMGLIGPQYGQANMHMHFHCVFQCSEMALAAEQ